MLCTTNTQHFSKQRKTHRVIENNTSFQDFEKGFFTHKRQIKISKKPHTGTQRCAAALSLAMQHDRDGYFLMHELSHHKVLDGPREVRAQCAAFFGAQRSAPVLSPEPLQRGKSSSISPRQRAQPRAAYSAERHAHTSTGFIRKYRHHKQNPVAPPHRSRARVYSMGSSSAIASYSIIHSVKRGKVYPLFVLDSY